MAKRTKTNKIGIQVGVVPYRWRDDELQVCLITSRRGHWGFPKGNIDRDESPWQAACRECFEEAGVRGPIDGPPFAIYKYQKANRRFDVSTYLMSVEETSDSWPEQQFRQRIWVSPQEARRLIRRVGVLEVMDRAIQQIVRKNAAEGRLAGLSTKRSSGPVSAKAGSKAKVRKAAAKTKSSKKTTGKSSASKKSTARKKSSVASGR